MNSVSPYSYCFVLIQQKIRIFRYKDNSLEPCNRDGVAEFQFSTKEDLWNWWANQTKYCKGESVDFLFLSDCDDLSLQPDYPQMETSVWSFDLLKDLCETLQYPKIELRYAIGKGQKCIKDTPGIRFPEAPAPLALFAFPQERFKADIPQEPMQNGNIFYEYYHAQNEQFKKNHRGG